MPGLQVFIGRELEERGLELAVVDFALLGEDRLVHIGAGDAADEVVKTLEIINILHFALHTDLGFVDHRRAFFAEGPGKGLGFIRLVAAEAAHAVGLLQPGGVYHVDGNDPVLPDALVGMVCLHHGEHQMAVRHDARVGHQSPVRFSVHHRPDHDHRSGIQRQLRPRILFHIDVSFQKIY